MTPWVGQVTASEQIDTDVSNTNLHSTDKIIFLIMLTLKTRNLPEGIFEF